MVCIWIFSYCIGSWFGGDLGLFLFCEVFSVICWIEFSDGLIGVFGYSVLWDMVIGVIGIGDVCIFDGNVGILVIFCR